MQATLEPSIAAIEAATILGRPADYLAKLRRASRDFKFELTDADKSIITQLRRDKSLSPTKREDMIQAVRRSSRNAQHAEWRKYQLEALRWVRVVRAYEIDRDWLAQRDPRVRKGILVTIERDVERAFRNPSPIGKLTLEESRWRASNRKDFRRHAKRNRSAFGYRGRSAGRTAWLIPDADGNYSQVEIATAEFGALVAEQNSGEANHGVSITDVEDVPKPKPEDMTQEERDEEAILARLKGEVRRFKQLRKCNGTDH